MAFESTTKKPRIYILDCVRFLAVTLALWSHAATRFSVYGPETELPGIIGHLTTALATPSLMILFGMMAHIAYARNFQRDPSGTTRNLVGRSLDCMAAVIIASLYSFANHQDWKNLFNSVVLQHGAYDYSVFRTYAVLLLIMPLILLLQRKLGWRAYILTLIAVQIYHFSTVNAAPVAGPMMHIGSMFGLGTTWGPSVIQALQFVVFGMALANAIRDRDLGSNMVVLGMLAIAIGLNVSGIMELGSTYRVNLVHGVYRATNDHHYYAYGILGFLTVLAAAWLLTKVTWPKARWFISTVGSHTLTYFLLGNMALAAAGAVLHVNYQGGGPLYAPTAALILALSAVAVLAWQELLKRFPIIAALRDETRNQVLNLIGFAPTVLTKEIRT